MNQHDEQDDEHNAQGDAAADDGAADHMDDDDVPDHESEKPFNPKGKFRGYAITYWNTDEEGTLWLKEFGVNAQYFVMGLETCPKTDRKHWQSYVYFKNQRAYNKLAHTFRGHRIRPAFKDAKTNMRYCKKIRPKDKVPNEIVWEFGELPQPGKRTDIDDCKEIIMHADMKKHEKKRKLKEEHFSTYVRYKRNFDEILAEQDLLERIHEPRTWKTEVHVYWGDTRTGKTTKARAAGAENVYIEGGRWIQKWRGQEVVLIDEFSEKQCDETFFKMLTDQHPHDVFIKGKSDTMNWNPKVIYVTTNEDPRNWWRGDKAVQARFTTVTHFGSQFNQ